MKPVTNSSLTTALIARRLAVVLLISALVGCAVPERIPEPAAPAPTPAPIEIPERTWLQVDRDIGAASLAAAGPARHFARERMEAWKQRITSRVETDFIPWFSSYWTQQGLSARVAWYQLSASENKPVATRLAAHLQTEFRDRVLAPVAREIDPETVRMQATEDYVRHFRAELRPIQLRYNIPSDRFERRLKAISAIELAPPPAHNASLYQLIQAEHLASLPAYVALLEQGRRAADEAGGGLLTTRISPVALRVSEKLLERLAISGGGSAVSALVGGIAGSVISLGAASVGIALHESAREATEAILRENLAAGLEEIWHSQIEDPVSGVMAGIDYLSDQIEKCCPRTFAQPVVLPPLLKEMPLPRGQTMEDGAAEENAEDDKPQGFQRVD